MWGRRHINAAWGGGVTSMVSSPLGTGLVLGTAAAYHTAPNFVSVDEVFGINTVLVKATKIENRGQLLTLLFALCTRLS